MSVIYLQREYYKETNLYNKTVLHVMVKEKGLSKIEEELNITFK